MRERSSRTLHAALAAMLAIGPIAVQDASAEVSRFEIVSRAPLKNDPAVERIEAQATIALDPANAANRVIVDLDKAQRDARGRVEAVTKVVILRPARPSGLMLVELPNRGRSQVYADLEDLDTAAGAALDRTGSGFLRDEGITLVVIGWQGDISTETAIGIAVPTVKGLVGPSREQWAAKGVVAGTRLTLSYPVADPATARLGTLAKADAAFVPLAASRWHVDGDGAVVIDRPVPGELYELRYQARDPKVMGMGFAAVRDVAAFLRADGSTANPLAQGGRSTIDRAIATGISQDGRALRDYLYQGFNADEAGKRVFEGMLPIIPGTRRSFTNDRFGQPGRNPGTQADQLYPVDQFPFAYTTLVDHLTGKRDGLLRRCGEDGTCPRIMELDSEYEFYGSRASLLVTDTRGKGIALPDSVRAYMLAGAPHHNAPGTMSAALPGCALPTSPIVIAPVVRALLVDLDQWIAKGTLPPPSRYPQIGEGTLVPPGRVYPPGIPLPYAGRHLHAYLVDQGNGNPRIRGEYPVLLPKAGPDGNAIAGIRLPEVAAPVATFTGWNNRTDASGPQDLCDHAGGMVPFAATPEARAGSDRRPSTAELYPAPGDRERAVRAAARALVRDRLLLPRDEEASVERALDLR